MHIDKSNRLLTKSSRMRLPWMNYQPRSILAINTSIAMVPATSFNCRVDDQRKHKCMLKTNTGTSRHVDLECECVNYHSALQTILLKGKLP
jgi:hypothetical protein